MGILGAYLYLGVGNSETYRMAFVAFLDIAALGVILKNTFIILKNCLRLPPSLGYGTSDFELFGLRKR